MGSVGAGSVSDIHLSCLVLFLKAYNGPSNAQSQPPCRSVFCCTATSRGVPPSFLSLGSSLLLASLFSVWSLPWHEGTGAATYLYSLAPLCCGERRTLQTLLARVGRPGSGWSPPQLPQPKALPLPGSQVGLEDTVPQGSCVRSGSWSWAVTFSVDVNWPRSQEDMVSSKSPLIAWEEVQSLGPRLQQPLAFHLWLLPTCLSFCGEPEKADVLLSFGITRVQSFVLWAHQWSQHGIRAFLQGRPFLLLCLSGIPVVWVFPILSMLCHISSFRVSPWHSTPSPFP